MPLFYVIFHFQETPGEELPPPGYTKDYSSIPGEGETAASSGGRLERIFALENDGEKFFGALGGVGSAMKEHFSVLSPDDVSGGLKAAASSFYEKSRTHGLASQAALQTVDVKNGWGPFTETANTPEVRAVAFKAPAAAAFFVLASMVYLLFGVVFCAAKYGPTAYSKLSEVAGNANERAIIPLKAKMRPLLANAKGRIEQALEDRKMAYQGVSAINEAAPESEAEI
jgi:hypothetical protein